MSAGRRVLLVVPDLFFVARIETAAAHLGVEVGHAEAARLVQACRERRPDLVIVDLHGGAGVLDSVRQIKHDPALANLPVVGFYSHVDDATRRAALEAGVDEAMPRSRFTARLASLLQRGG
jgi:CheY-like chemotaxis protein